jgi:hypothetical protein
MRDFFLANSSLRIHLDFHTHGYMILWPWGYTSELCADNDTFQLLGDEMAARIFAVRGTDYDRRGPIYTTIYPVSGGSVDYTYGVHDVLGMAYELGYSHSMPISEIIPTCEEITPAVMYLTQWIFDCNENGVPDGQEIAEGLADDCNGDGIPDECLPPGAPVEVADGTFAMNRLLAIKGPGSGEQLAIRVSLNDLPPPHDTYNGSALWLGAPSTYCENSGEDVPPAGGECGPAPGALQPTFLAATLVCDPVYMDWSMFDTIYVFHEFIVPGAVYAVYAVDEACGPVSGGVYSSAFGMTTGLWGDLVEDCTPRPEGPCLPPDGSVGITTDVTGVLDKFKNLNTAPSKARCDLQPGAPDLIIDISDVSYCVDAFRGEAYPFAPGPWPCDMP